MEKIIKRSEQKKENTWAVEDIFASDTAWLEAFDALAAKKDIFAAYEGKIGKDAKLLYEFMTLSEQLDEELTKVYVYASLKSDEDKGNSKYADFLGRARTLAAEFAVRSSFEGPEIVAIPDDVLEGFYNSVPELREFKLYFDRRRMNRAHTRNRDEEGLIASASEVTSTPSTVYGAFLNADIRYPDIKAADGTPIRVTQGSFIPLMESSDVNIRRQAFESVYHTLASYKNTFAAMLDAEVKTRTFYTKARSFGSNLERALFGNEVPVSVYENLVASVNAHLPAMHKYVGLRKKLMGVDELHMYDVYTPIAGNSEKKYTFEESKELCRKALVPLGENYLKILEEGFSSRWIDVYENEGKRGGAYSMGALPHPYVLLNHKDTLDSAFTLIHEMGHAIHSYLSQHTQRPFYAGYVIFVAEVASTFNENLLMQYLLSSTSDKTERAYLINHFLEEFRGTVYRQTMFAEFEKQINEMSEKGITLTADNLCEVYYDLNRRYFGEDMVVDKEIAMEWARIPHFYRNFYVYQYATGFSAAIALSQRVLNEGESAVRDYIGFLSGGCTKSPIELLKGAGIDMTTSKPIDDALDYFGKLVDEFEELMK